MSYLLRAIRKPRRSKTLCVVLLAFVLGTMIPRQAGAYLVTFKEQYYRLYHLHLIQYPDDTMENIYWLEKALAADFCNPLYALALIENKTQWEKYRYLFMMHINLKLIEQHIYLGNKWNKRNAYFYNAPWKAENLDSLKTAESCYRAALAYWKDAKDWAAKARERRFYFISLPRVQNWDDEAFRIEEGKLDYERILNRELKSLADIRARFEAMNDSTY